MAKLLKSLSAKGTPVYKELLYLSLSITLCNLAALATDTSAQSSGGTGSDPSSTIYFLSDLEQSI